MVVGLVSARPNVGDVGLCQRLLLELHVRLQVHGSGLDRFVAQPQCDNGAIDTVVEQVHGEGVSKHMWRDVFDRQ